MRKSRAALLALLGACSVLAALPMARAQETATLTNVYSFSGVNGVAVDSKLVQGSDGNFYGTTAYGGPTFTGLSATIGGGTVFKLTPAGALTTLYSFTGGSDGDTPSQLVQGTDGNFYGTTDGGGGASNAGTVFEITPAGVLTTLYTFTAANDGAVPFGGLSLGGDGNFYGTTTNGGVNGYGTVYKITPAGALTTLYAFSGSDGAFPGAAPLQGSDGNFYGTTAGDGTDNDGTVYKITPAGALTSLYAFTNGSDGARPTAPVVQGSDGNFYGTTAGDGTTTFGTVFKITPAGALTPLYAFTNSGGGGSPESALAQGDDGNFYGTTVGDGTTTFGAIFQITPAGVLTVLYTFDGSNGAVPQAGLLRGSDGNFYGGTAGLTYDDGTVFKLAAYPAFFTGEVALSNGVYYLALPNGNPFGYYSFLPTDPDYIYHFDLGYEYVFNADDGNDGVYFYDFASNDFFYTSPTFPFPYLYDFGLNSVVYYYPDPANPGRYNTDGVRYFYVFSTGQIISK